MWPSLCARYLITGCGDAMSFGIITKVLRQDAIYWAPAAVTDGRGDRKFEAPIAVRCRWDGKSTERNDSQGSRFLASASVMLDRDVVPGGVLYLGTIDGFSTIGGDPMDPLSTQGAALIRDFGKIPTLKADKFVRTAYL